MKSNYKNLKQKYFFSITNKIYEKNQQQMNILYI